MIGLILRVLGFGLPGEGFFAILMATSVACCATCCIYRCSQCRMRDCNCLKRWMRATGMDSFDDFEMMVLVHEALYVSGKQKMGTEVRLTAGEQQVTTDESTKGIYQQPLVIFVEQGTETVKIELLSSNMKKVLGVLKLNTTKDILNPKKKVQEKLFSMKQRSKDVLNPRIKLTIHLEGSGADAESGMLSGVNLSAETDLMLRQQLSKVTHEEEERGTGTPEMKPALSEIDLLAKGCAGPLDKFGSWGTRKQVYVAVQGPPASRRYKFGVWRDQKDYQKGYKADPEVDLMKILSVQPDPRRTEVFVIHYLDEWKQTKRLTFRRIDRATTVWVELFQLLIKTIRESKEMKKKLKP